MTSDVGRILRRVCARFKTGIRKPFELNGESFFLEPGCFLDADDEGKSLWCEALLVIRSGGVNALDGSRFVTRIPLIEVTVESVWTAYLQNQVDAVHAL